MQKLLQNIFIGILIFSLLGCQAPQEEILNTEEKVVPTASEIPSATAVTILPTATETAIPSPTATPLAPTSDVQIYAEDLPNDFVEVSWEILDIDSEKVAGQKFLNEHIFLFTHTDELHFVLGFSTQLNSEESKAKFQKIIEDPEASMEVFSVFYGAEEITKYKGEKELRELGDAQVAADAILKLDENSFGNLELIAFQKDDVGVYLLNFYLYERRCWRV